MTAAPSASWLNLIPEMPSYVLFFGCPVIVASALSIWRSRASLLAVSAGGTALGNLLNLIYYVLVWDFGPLFVAGLIYCFLLLLPLGWTAALFSRLLLGRPLRMLQSARASERREARRTRKGA